MRVQLAIQLAELTNERAVVGGDHLGAQDVVRPDRSVATRRVERAIWVALSPGNASARLEVRQTKVSST